MKYQLILFLHSLPHLCKQSATIVFYGLLIVITVAQLRKVLEQCFKDGEDE